MSQPWRYLAVALLLALALPTGIVALLEGIGHLPLPFNLYVIDLRLPVVFKLHMLASGAVLVLTPLVLFVRRNRRWHRPLGRLTGALVVIGGLTSFPVALESSSPLVARAGFAAQALVWLAFVTLGVRAARARAFGQHATCMLAMSAVASGAIWVRLTTAVVTSCDLPFDPIYSAAAWLGWIVPMGLVLIARRGSHSQANIWRWVAPRKSIPTKANGL